jgi:diguanylate cyclase
LKQIVPDPTDWKEKYRDSVAEMQAEEHRWRETEQVLRKIVGRLCAGAMGLNPQFDDEMRALAAANRRNASAEELARLTDCLRKAVVAVDALDGVPSPLGAPAPPASDANAAATSAQTTTGIQEALRFLLEELPLDSNPSVNRTELLAELAAARGDATLAAVVSRAADLIGAYGDSVARERLQAAAVLGEVTRGLEQMTAYLTENSHERQHGYDAARSHDDSVMLQVANLSLEVGSATELSILQSLVKTRLERVTREVCDFRAREETRLLESNGKTGQMVARIARLEREARELNAKLDREQKEARLDALTGVANRKSFDERFAVEIARRQHISTPGVMIIWDIDDFKRINDTYGHRAGDRVLQNVAACFKSGARRGHDLAARIGGEEFAILMDGMTMPEALKIANTVRAAVQALRFHFRGTPILVTVSCGLTDLRSPDTVEAAFDRADSALYRAKRGGKNLCIGA